MFEFPVSSFQFPVKQLRGASCELRVIALTVRIVSFAAVALLLMASGFASELKVKVVDPQAAVVAGARAPGAPCVVLPWHLDALAAIVGHLRGCGCHAPESAG